jgi:hypothetical protein
MRMRQSFHKTDNCFTHPNNLAIFYSDIYGDRGGSGIRSRGIRVRRATFGATLRAQNASIPALRCVLNTIRSVLLSSATWTMV